MTKLNNTDAIAKRGLPGPFRSPMHFGPEASPEYPSTSMMDLNPSDPPVRNTNAGPEGLSDAIACLKYK